MDAEPTKPWWRRKRWWLAGLLWAAIPLSYPLSIGPATYCASRGWLSKERLTAAYAPITRARYASHPAGRSYSGYIHWWRLAGMRHAGKAWPPPRQPSPPKSPAAPVLPAHRGELPRLLPDRDGPSEGIAATDVPPLPSP